MEPRQRLFRLGSMLSTRMIIRRSSTGPGQRSGIATQIRAPRERSALKASPMKEPNPGLLNARKSRTKRSSIGPGQRSGQMIQRMPRTVMTGLSILEVLGSFMSSLMERSRLVKPSWMWFWWLWLPGFRLLRVEKDLVLSGTSLVDLFCAFDRSFGQQL